MTVGILGTPLGEIMAESTHANSPENQEQIRQVKEVVGKPAKGIGRGGEEI